MTCVETSKHQNWPVGVAAKADRMPVSPASMTASAPAGSFSRNLLCRKGNEQCDYFKYLAPWRDTNTRAEKAIVNEFGNTPDDHPGAHVSTCGSIDAASVGRGDKLTRENSL
jgi:hypothetical protein